MSRTILAAICCAAASAAVAQPAPSPGPTPLGSPPAPAATPSGPPSPPAEMRTNEMARAHGGLGPSIRLRGPGGTEVSVRCASGESTKACADVVAQLMERAMAARPDRRRDDDDDGPRADRYRDRDRY